MSPGTHQALEGPFQICPFTKPRAYPLVKTVQPSCTQSRGPRRTFLANTDALQTDIDGLHKDQMCIRDRPHTGAADEKFFPRGVRHQAWLADGKTAARRGVEMLIKKLNGEPYQTELVIPAKDLVPIAPAIKDLSKARIALCTTGGIVPVDNPDHIQSASATRWGRYDISGMDRLESGVFKTIHAGFDPAAANADPNVIVPLDAMRARCV